MEEYEDPEPKGKLILKVGRLVSKYFMHNRICSAETFYATTNIQKDI